MSANRTTAAVNFGYNGAANLTIESNSSTARTLTLGGNINGNFGGPNGETVTIGNSANPVNVILSGNRNMTAMDTTDKLVFQGDISDGGSGFGLTAGGNGTLLLNGANTYSGTTTITSGTTLQVGDGTNGTAMIGNASCSTNAGSVSVSGTLQYDLNADAQQFNTFTGAGGADIVLLNNTAPYSIKFDGTNSSFNGTVTIQSNTRVQLDNTSFSNSSSIVVQSGGGLFVNFTTSYGGSLSLAGGGYSGDAHGFGALRTSFTDTFSGPITLTADAVISGTGGSPLTVSGNIGDGGNGYQLTVTGRNTGSVILSGTNTYSGGTIIDGTVTLGSNSALPTNGNLTIGDAVDLQFLGADAPGILTMNGFSATVGALNISGAGVGNEITNGASTSSTLTIGGGNASGAFAGLLDDGGTGKLAIVKTGSGTQSLSGANTYTGNTTLSSGELDINSNTALGTGTFIINGGSIDNTSGSAVTLTNNNAQTWGGNFSYGGTNDLNLGTGAVTFSATRTITVNGAANLTVAGNLSGAANALLVTGPGTLILSGTNSFSGGLQINSGTQSSTRVVAASSGALGSGTVQIAPGGNAATATLVLTGGITISNAISIFGRNASNAPAIESLAGSNTLSSTLSLQTGGTYYPIEVDSGSTLTLSAANSINAGSLTSTRTVPLMGAGTGNINGTITEGTSTTGLIANQTGTWNLKGTGTFSGGVTLNSGTTSFINGALGSGTITFGGTSTLQWATGNTQDVSASIAAIPTAVTAIIDTNANNVTFASVISGNGALQKNGSGSLTLSAANTLSGGVTLSAGQLNLNNAAAPGTGTFTINGGTIDNTSAAAITLSNNNPQAWNGSFTFVGTKNLNLGTGTATLGASVTATVGGVLTVGGTITDGASTFALAKAGTGTLILAGPGTFDGGVTLSTGQLNINSATAVGTGTLTIAGGTTIDNTSGGSITLSNNNVQTWNGSFTFTGSSNLNMGTGAVTLGASPTVTTTSGILTVGGIIGGGAQSITKAGGGTLVLSGANTFTSGVTLSAGELDINNAAALGTGTFTVSGGSIDNSSGGAITLSNNNAQNWNASFTFVGSSNLSMGTGAVTLGANPTVTVTAGTLSVGGVIGGVHSVTKAGTGTLTLSGANTFGNGMTLSAGGLNINNATALGTGTFTIAAGTTIDNTSGGAITVSSNNAQTWNGSFTFTGSNNLNLGTGAVALAANPTITTSAGVLTVGGVVSGGGHSITTAGTGTLVLLAANGYSGGTTLTGGTLSFANGALGSGTITFNGGTLQWNGANTQDVSSTFVAVGSGITANVDTNGNSVIFGSVIGGAGSMQKLGTGTLTLSAANTISGGFTLTAGQLNINNAAALGTGTFTIAAGTTIDNTTGAAITDSNNNAQAWNGDFTFTGTKNLNLGTGAVTPSGNRIITVTAGLLTVGGAIGGGAISLTKAGAGTLALAGANTYSAGMTLSAGQLNINNATALASGAFTIAAATKIDNTSAGAITESNNNAGTWNGSFTFVGTQNLNLGTGAVTLTASPMVTTTTKVLTVGGAIGGAFSLTKAGAGTLALSGGSNYSGGMTLSAGQLNINNATALGTGTFTISGGKIDNTSAGAITESNNNAGSWGASFTFVGTQALNLGTGAITLTANPTVTTTANVLTAGGAISGAHKITKAGAGTLVLSGANTFTNGVTLSAGELDINSATALGAAAGTLTIAAGTTIDNTSGGALTETNNNPQSWNGDFTFVGSSDLNLGAGAVAMNASRIVTTNGHDLTVGGAISGNTFSLTKAGAGTMTLSGANTFTGGATLSAGQLNINNATAVGTNTFTINGGVIDNTSGGTITLSNNNAQTWGGDFTFVGTNNLNLGTGAVTLGANRVVTTSGGVLTAGGVISGAGLSLTKAGAGTLVLAGVNAFTGGMILNAGELDINNAAAIGTGTFTINGGVIDNTSGAAITLSNNNAETWAANFTFAGANDLNLGTGAIALTADVTVTDPAKTLTVGGIISGAHSLTKSGAGTMTLSGSNTYSAGTTLVSGRLNLNTASALGTGTFTIDSGTLDNSSGGTLTISNAQTWAGSFTFLGTGSLNMGTGAISLTAATTITVAAGALAIAGVISGGFALNKSGSGTETLTGANTFTGGTTLSAGILYVNNSSGSGTGTGAVTVNGGTLAGTGSVSGSLTVNSGGTLDPGVGGPSTFASGPFSIASGTFDVDINSSTAGTGYDQLNVTGTVNLTGSTLHLNGTRTSNGGDTIVLINNDGADAVTGTFSGLAEGALVSLNGVNYNISYHGGDGNDVVLTDAAPTVATAASATPSPVTGTTTALSVLGASSNGESTLTYTWAVTAQPASSNPQISSNGSNADKNVTVTFDKAGSYTFQVTISDGTYTATSSVTVTVNQTLTTIDVSPASATLNENGTQQFSASAYDQFGALLSSQPSFTWTKTSGVGSIDGTGLYTAPYGSGSAVIQAASGGVNGTASITVNNAAPTIATHAAATPSTVTGTTTVLSVLGADDGGESNLTYTWAATSSPASSNPQFSASNGSNAGKNTTVTFDMAGSYTFQVTIDDGTNQVTDTVSVTVNQTFTTIAVSPGSVTLNENATQQFSAIAKDQFGIAMASQPGLTWTETSGVGSIDGSGLYTAPYGTGTAVIQAASAGINGTASITVNNAAPTIATHAAATPSPVTGTTTALSVLGADDGGETNLTYSWTVTASPASSSPLFSANNTNAAKNSTVTFDKSGNYTFQVTIDDGTNQITDTVSVTVQQTLTTIALTPATVTLNENATQQFTATGKDQFGDPLASQPSFTWTETSGIGSIDSSGLYTAPYGTGTATVQAANGAVNNTASITIVNATPTIATHAAATPSPVTGTTTALSVLGADDGGETNLTYTWSVTSQPASSNPTLGPNGDNAAKNITITFDMAGSYTFHVVINDGTNQVSDDVTVVVDQTLTTIDVSPATATLDENGTQQFTAIAYDQFNDAMTAQPSFTWSKTSGVGIINAGGLYTAPNGTGSAVIEADSGGISGSAAITINNAPPTLISDSANPSPVTGLSTDLSVVADDDGGEPNLVYNWTVTSKPAGSHPLITTNNSNAAKNTTVMFDTAGDYTFQVTIDDGTNQITDSITLTVQQTLTSITVTPGTATLNENGTQQFDATGYDQFNAPMAAQPAITWSQVSGVGAIDGTGLYTAPYGTGSAVIKAANGSVSGTASITINNASPTIATHVAANPNPVTGTTTNLTVLGADDGGEPNLTYTWTLTSQPASSNPQLSDNGDNAAKNITATFDTAGSYAFLVTIDDGTNQVTDSVTVVVNQTLTSIDVSPTSAALNENQTQQFTAVAKDQFGDPMSTQPSFTWSETSGVGSIDSSGLYTAPYGTGSATIQAAVGGVSNTATITITNAPPTIATHASATPSPVTGLTTVLSVLGADDGGENNLTYSWSVTSQPPSSNPQFNASNGSNAGKNTTVTFDTAGTYTFLVTIDDGTNQVTDGVTVVVDQTLTTITVSPASATLNENQTQQFSAVAYDQFHNAMTAQPSFSWSKTGGIGAIDGTGLYTAPSGTGSAADSSGERRRQRHRRHHRQQRHTHHRQPRRRQPHARHRHHHRSLRPRQ